MFLHSTIPLRNPATRVLGVQLNVLKCHDSSQLLQKLWTGHLIQAVFDYFLQVIPFPNPAPWELEVHINSMGSITIHISDQKIIENKIGHFLC